MTHFPPLPPAERLLLEHTITHFGAGAQVVKAAEEYAEAAAALARLFNEEDPRNLYHLAEEMADAEIMRRQMCIIYPELGEYLEAQFTRKLDRLKGLTEFKE